MISFLGSLWWFIISLGLLVTFHEFGHYWVARRCGVKVLRFSVGFAWPRRLESGVAGLDLLAHGRLDFEAPDLDAFPCLRLAFAALQAAGTAPATLNAANEVAVSAFLQDRIGFLSIPALVEDTLAAIPPGPALSLAALGDADARARRHAGHAIATGTVP